MLCWGHLGGTAGAGVGMGRGAQGVPHQGCTGVTDVTGEGQGPGACCGGLGRLASAWTVFPPVLSRWRGEMQKLVLSGTSNPRESSSSLSVHLEML